MIMKTHTVPNPWTMMIHSQNAFLAQLAMVTSLWLNCFTLKTITNLIQQFNLFPLLWKMYFGSIPLCLLSLFISV